MNLDNLIQAQNRIYDSEISLYIPKEKIQEAFSNIYVYEKEEDFIKAFGKNSYHNGGILEGFNRNGISHLGPNATSHTIIHEVLHELSSEFDSEGHRTKNGIMGDDNLNFANQVNEGCTDYLATKLSGEEPRHYIQGHKLFEKLESILIKYT